MVHGVITSNFRIVLCLHLQQLFGLQIFFFNDTATTEIYTLSLHDALPISNGLAAETKRNHGAERPLQNHGNGPVRAVDRKSTRLNSSHVSISYAVFCLKKKTKSPDTKLFLLPKSFLPTSTTYHPRTSPCSS